MMGDDVSENRSGAIAFLEHAYPWTGRIVEYADVWSGYVVEVTNTETGAPPERMFMEEPEGGRSHEEIVADALVGFLAREEAERATPLDHPFVDHVLHVIEDTGFFEDLENYIEAGLAAVKFELTVDDDNDEISQAFRAAGYTEEEAQQALDRMMPVMRSTLHKTAHNMISNPVYRRETARGIVVTLRAHDLLYGAQAAATDDRAIEDLEELDIELQINGGSETRELIDQYLPAEDIIDAANDARSDALRTFIEMFLEYFQKEGRTETRRSLLKSIEKQRALQSQNQLVLPEPASSSLILTHPIGEQAPKPKPRTKRFDGHVFSPASLGSRMYTPTTSVPQALHALLDPDNRLDRDGGGIYSVFLNDNGKESVMLEALPEIVKQADPLDFLFTFDDDTFDTAMAILSIALNRPATKSYQDKTRVMVSDLLTMKGIPKHNRAHRIENLVAETERLQTLMTLRVRIEGMEIFEPGPKGKTKRSRIGMEDWLIVFGPVIDKQTLDEDVFGPRVWLAFDFHLGEWAKGLFNGTQKYLGRVTDELFKLPGNASMVKRLGWYLVFNHRIRARQASYADKRTVRDLLGKAHIDFDAPGAKQNPTRFRAQFENGLNELRDSVHLISRWDYVLDEKGLLPPAKGKGSRERWLNSEVIIIPDRDTLQTYRAIPAKPVAKAKHAAALRLAEQSA